MPPDKKPVDDKWVFKEKTNPDRSIAKHKARLVARAFFSPKTRLGLLRIICTSC